MFAESQPPEARRCNRFATALVLPEPVEPTMALCRMTSEAALKVTGTSGEALNRPRQILSAEGGG